MNFKQIRYLNFRAITKLASDSLYRNSLFMALSSFFNAGCGFFFWIIAARLYTVEQVGLATALISSLGLVILFSRLGFDSSVIRFFASEDKGRIISTSLIVTTGASIIFGGMCILLMMILTPSMPLWQEPGYSMAFILIAALNSIAVMGGYAFVADRKADQFFLQNLLQAIRIPALVPLAFLGVFGIFGSVGLGHLAASSFCLLMLQRSKAAIRPEIDMNYMQRSFRFSTWNYVANLLSLAPTLIIPIMVLNMLGEAEAAKYYIAFAIGNIVLIIPSSLGTSLFVEGSHGESMRKSVLRAVGASLMLLLPAVLILILFGDKLLGMLKEEYVEAFDLLRIIALSSLPAAVYSLFVPIQNVRMKVESIVGLNVLRCMLLLGLSYVLMQRYGILGAGYAWIVTYGVIMLGIAGVLWKEKWI